MVNSAQLMRVGDAHPLPFTLSSFHHEQSVVYAPAERADTLLLFLLHSFLLCVADHSLEVLTKWYRYINFTVLIKPCGQKKSKNSVRNEGEAELGMFPTQHR
jgi:hypothetical protein